MQLVKNFNKNLFFVFFLISIVLTACAHDNENLPDSWSKITFRTRNPLIGYYADKIVPFCDYIHELMRRWNIPQTKEQYLAKRNKAVLLENKIGRTGIVEKIDKEQYKDRCVTRRYPFIRDIVLCIGKEIFDKCISDSNNHVICQINPVSLADLIEHGANFYLRYHTTPGIRFIYNYCYQLRYRLNIPNEEEEWMKCIQSAYQFYEETNDPYPLEFLMQYGYKTQRITLAHPILRDVIIYPSGILLGILLVALGHKNFFTITHLHIIANHNVMGLVSDGPSEA